MKLLAYYCRAGHHTQCPARGDLCKCPCHKNQPTEEPIVTDHIQQAAQVLRNRINEIDRHLEQYDTIRAERRQIEAALRKLCPEQKKTRATTNGTRAPSLKNVLRKVFAADPKAELNITDITSEVELAGWSSAAVDPSATIRTTCDQLVRAGELSRPRAGIYKAVT